MFTEIYFTTKENHFTSPAPMWCGMFMNVIIDGVMNTRNRQREI